MSNSTKLAHSLLRQLIEVGVSDFVISPGSRNAPLAIALGEAASKEIIDVVLLITHLEFPKQVIIMLQLFVQVVPRRQIFTQPLWRLFIATTN